MFWESVARGLGVLLWWQTWVAGLEYLVILVVPSLLLGRATAKLHGPVDLLNKLAALVLQVTAIAVLVLTLSPLIFGFGQYAMWSLPWTVSSVIPGELSRLIGTLGLIAIGLMTFPVLGQLQSLHTLLLGSTAVLFAIGIMRALLPDLGTVEHIIPGPGFIVGLVVTCLLVSWAEVTARAAIAQSSLREDRTADLLTSTAATLLGFMPVFIYGAWLGAQLRR